MIGFIGAAVAIGGLAMEDRLHIDDPVGAFPTHALASVWGLIATGLFCERTPEFVDNSGLFKGGTWKFLGVQILAIASISSWAAITTFLLLTMIDKIFGLRMTDEQEEVGADFFVHNISGYETNLVEHTSAAAENLQIIDENLRTNEDTTIKYIPPVNMENLREISSKKPEKRLKTWLTNGNEIPPRVDPFLEESTAFTTGTHNSGYHTA